MESKYFDKNTIDGNLMTAIRKFTPGTKFISHFGARDTVNDSDSFKIDDDGCIFVYGDSQYRLIFNGHWVEIID